MSQLSLDLVLTIKETQVQHGLRSEDFGRYHRYLTNRLAALRKQLGMSNDKKKFVNKQVPNTHVKDARAILLLALYAERCWAESEQQMAQRVSAGDDRTGLPPATQARKRLNKAVHWTEKLVTVATNNADARLQIECRAYAAEMRGRCALSHSQHADAKAHFTAARGLYFSLRAHSTEPQWVLVMDKVRELDDRVVYTMQCLGEDPTTYRPALDEKGGAGEVSATVQWLGRNVPVYSVKAKDALREIAKIDAFGARDAAVQQQQAASAGAATLPTLIPLGTQTRVLDAFDRIIGRYNDALIAARQELRDGAESRKRDLQLFVHYLQYQISFHTLHRTLFMVNVFRRRFVLTRETLRRKRAAAADGTDGTVGGGAGALLTSKKLKVRTERELIPDSLFASPAELVRLFDSALQALGDMELLPGVEGSAALGPLLEALTEECRAGRLYFLGEGWRIADEPGMAAAAFEAARAAAANAKPGSPAAAYAAEASKGLLATTAENAIAKAAESSATPPAIGSSSSGGGSSSGRATRYIADRPDDFVACSGIVKFPPDYQPVPVKPVFVDIASTYVDFPTLRATGGGGSVAAAAKKQPQQQPTASSQGASTAADGDEAAMQKKGSWFGGWGWGKK